MSINLKSRRQILVISGFCIFVVVLSLLLFKPLIVGWANTETSKEQLKQTLPTDSKTAGSDNSEKVFGSLAEQLDNIIEKSGIASARWGVSVISVRDERTIYSRNSEKLFTPASNMKIFTTGVALDLLGPEYRWRTSIYADAQPDPSGTIKGNLRLYGRGAPDLVSQKTNNNSSLAQLADDLYNRGIRRISGNVIGDESYFRGDSVGEGWQWNDLQWYFGAEASALTVNHNEIHVNVLPASKSATTPIVNVSDVSGHLSVQNNMATVKGSARMVIGIQRGLSDNNIQVWGEFPSGSKGFGARLSVHNPALWATRLFLAALKARGIAVEGTAETRDSHQSSSSRFDPTSAVELAFTSSKSLSEIVKETNKESLNLYAELMLRTLGRERGDMVASPDPGGRERGDDEAGLAVIRLWVVRAGISTQGMALHDGSGLSRLNLVTPESMSRMLIALSKTAIGPSFRQSLPISGRDGTLGGRLKEITDLVTAKTGSLTYDTALSGYLTTAGGENLAFSFVCNDQTSRASTGRVIDQLVLAIAERPTPK